MVAPGVHLLDLAGPAQAFATAAELADRSWRFSYVAETATVTSHQGLVLQPETSWPSLTPEDLIVVPGWRAGGKPHPSRLARSTLDRIARHHAEGGTVMSVCGGAFALAESGLLNGRRATTHHELQEELAQRYPAVSVIQDVLFVTADRVHTSAGIASGIDLSLHVIAERLGARIASRVARAMVVFARRNGSEPQASVLLRYRHHVDELAHRTQDIIDELYTRSLPLALLAEKVGASQRTVTRAFTRAVGMTPLRYQQALRRERADLLIASGVPIETAARKVGFEDARMLRRLRQNAG
ncbi:AraC family transcriptional regulator with amidase-like domain [Stackebrandtia endophytica]|uniref:AraC family transcriptional regulator with amidase-like domain n=1 Tax=Stackebrandtia endophytica TaxID=1496996 RepID=A0A543B2I2_9ACTN|nr:AraC family transcriptional regulator with amidase-like domain [Stackebrandtia endophytica]